jgi:hypothetical protein
MTSSPAVKKVEAQEPDDLALAAAVARVVELEDVRLVRVQAELSVSVDELLADECLLVISPIRHSVTYSEENAVLDVEVSVAASLCRPQQDNNSVPTATKPLATASATCALRYSLAASPPPAELRNNLFESFAKINGVYNAWPYLRNTIHDVTGRLGIPPVVLPVYRVPRRQQAKPDGAE